MIIFHGGFTLDQVNKLKSNDYILYPRSEYKNFRINISNTFNYSSIDKNNKKKEIINDIIDQNYINQWIHCFKYLINTLDFCYQNDYIVAFDINEHILEKYIGVGNYKFEGYRVEYRLPRDQIDSSIITDIIGFKPSDDDFIKELKQKYSNNYRSDDEHFEAEKIIKKIKQKPKYL